MADAQDLKSCGRLLPCGFESRSGYWGIAETTVFTVFSCGFVHRLTPCYCTAFCTALSKSESVTCK